MNFPWVESPFFNEILKTKNLSEEDKQLATEYHNNGFVILKNVFSEEVIDQVKADMNEKGFNEDFPVTVYRDKTRIQDLWQYSDSAKQISANDTIMKTLGMLYDREPIPFQTLNFKFGSQQRAHSDTIHFSSIPARYMCGVWVALEDVTPENGAVFYYTGSHRMPEYNFAHIKDAPEDTSYTDYVQYEDFMQNIMNVSEYEKKFFFAKKGDALIWSSNIIHGGSKVELEGSTRYSQVTHYYFKDCIYYTPMLSNMVTNELYLRNGFTNIKTGEAVQSNFNGHKITPIPTAKDKSILNNRMDETKKIMDLIKLKNKIIKKLFK